MEKEKIRGICPPGNSNGDRREKEFDMAKEMVEKADCQNLFVLYQKAIDERFKIEDALMTAMSVRSGSDDPGNVIRSMERITMAALDIAKQLAFKE